MTIDVLGKRTNVTTSVKGRTRCKPAPTMERGLPSDAPGSGHRQQDNGPAGANKQLTAICAKAGGGDDEVCHVCGKLQDADPARIGLQAIRRVNSVGVWYSGDALIQPYKRCPQGGANMGSNTPPRKDLGFESHRRHLCP
eukprot:5383426-Prymnesium_polylepis.1